MTDHVQRERTAIPAELPWPPASLLAGAANTHADRVARCKELMEQHGLDVLLLAKPANLFYLTGDGRLCAFAMVTRDGKVALGVPVTDVQEVRQLAYHHLLAGFDDEVGMIHGLAHYFEHFGISTGVMGLEYTFLTQSMMGMLTHPHGKPAGVTVKDCTPVMTALRLVKDEDEIRRMRAAARAADAGIAAAVVAVREGATESEIAGSAEYAMRHAGAHEFYRTYVSSGPRTNIAHGLPTLRRLEKGDLVMIDVAPVVGGYSADECRTVCVGQPTAEQHGAYSAYLKAQEAAISKVRTGGTVSEIEATMHGSLKESGHGGHIFGPPIHGVGIEFEEAPLPAGHAFFHGEAAPRPLSTNTVLAVGNCGLYAGPWGVRVEDTVVACPEGPEVLTGYPRRLNR